MTRPFRPLRSRRSAAMLAAAFIVLILSSCSLGAASQSARRAPTATPLAVPPTVSATLGPPPTDCATVDPPQTLTVTDFGGGFSGTVSFFGAAPAWSWSLGGGELLVRGTPYPSTKTMWVVGPNYNQKVTLSGKDLRSGEPLWFDVYPSNDPHQAAIGVGIHTQAVLDPAGPNRGTTQNSTGSWGIWGIGIIVTTAGCYELDVTSPTSSWHTLFAAGAFPPLGPPPSATP